MLKIDKAGFPRISEDKINFASVKVPTESGNPFHNPFTGEFTFAPPGVKIFEGEDLFRDLSTSSRKVVFDRVALTQANQASARIINGNLHIVLLRDGRRLDSFGFPPKEIQKEDAEARENNVQFPDSKLQITGEIRDAIMAAARDLDLVGGALIAFIEEQVGTKFSREQKKELLRLINEQRINDLIDYLHQNLRKQELNEKDQGKIRILTPRGYIRRTFARLDEIQVQEVLTRLQARGWLESVIQERVVAGLPQRFKNRFHVEAKELIPDTEEE